MELLFLITTLGTFLRAQTVYQDRTFFDLTIANDGRVEALLNAGDPKWMTVYRQFLQLNPDTRELMLVFDVGESDYPSIETLKYETHIISSTIGSGEMSWGRTENVTENPEGYIHSNMVLWYDRMNKEMVMIYQSSSYWYWSEFYDDWSTDVDLDAYDQTLQLTRLTDEGWSESVQVLSGLDNPHIHFQILESLDLNEAGYPSEIMLPVHHLSEGTAYENYEMVVRTDRSLSAENDWNITFLNETENGGKGYLQASIVRVPGDNKLKSTLVAFLRDAQGYWVHRSTSEDDGFSWTDPAQLALPNPDQMSQALYLHSGLIMLIYNPTQSMPTGGSAGDRYANAHSLAVGLSNDLGSTWQYSRMLEYAYDGMFNYPVALQDPDCSRVYVTYSVETNELFGCDLLDECTDSSQNHMAYIKFTILTERWVMNDFDYSYSTSEDCLWQLSPVLELSGGVETSVLESSKEDTLDWTAISLLSTVLGLTLLLNAACFYIVSINKKQLEYIDLEIPEEMMTVYRTTD